ncbi:MAG: hypothetical protein MNPFHGCM_02447 [Gemmatimonadaceae bacterium]|nr:hypothetical protein [Gemmatimonadaceae bacterium]
MAWKGFFIRLIASVALVYATFNPTGVSYYHWALAPLVRQLDSFDALKFLIGVVLFAGWVVFLQATRRSIGWKGALLVAAVCAGLIWLLAEQHMLNTASGTVLTHLGLAVAAIILAIGMSWSHVSRRVTGQADTDVVG